MSGSPSRRSAWSSWCAPSLSGAAGEPVIEQIGVTQVLRLRDQLLPLVNLGALLELPPPPPQPEAGAGSAGLYIVVAQVGTGTLGIIVDRVFDIEEIVVKPVAPILRQITMFSGNTILGDGSVIMILDPNGIARACGLGGDRDSRGAGAGDAGRHTDPSQGARVAMLLFRAGSDALKAVRLALVARLEDVPSDRIENASGQFVTQYRGRLMPLVPLSGPLDTERPRHCVLVFNDGSDAGEAAGGCVGLVVDEIVDVVETELQVELAGSYPGLVGTAVIAGRATDLIDTEYWLNQARHAAGSDFA